MRGEPLADELRAAAGLLFAGADVDELATEMAGEGLSREVARDLILAAAAAERERHGVLAGAEVLDAVRAFVARFVALPSLEALDAVTLWAVHTHLLRLVESTPRLIARSVEPGSGKTRLVEEVLGAIVARPFTASNATPAALWRLVGRDPAAPPTLLLDEVDTIFRPAKGDDPAAELRCMINSGHRRGASVWRCVGPRHDVTEFPVFAPVALAGLSRVRLPDSVLTRSVVIDMRRRSADERVEPWRAQQHAAEAAPIRERLAAWAEEVPAEVPLPTMPPGVTDRPADVWEPLLLAGELAGGEWPERARRACIEFVKATTTDDSSLGVLLLEHLRNLFKGRVAMPTADILRALNEDDEAPWGDLRGRALDSRGLARLLKPYDVRPRKVKVEGVALKGYHVEHAGGLRDAWTRYLSPLSTEGEPGEPGEPSNAHGTGEVPEVPQVPHVRPGSEGAPGEGSDTVDTGSRRAL